MTLAKRMMIFMMMCGGFGLLMLGASGCSDDAGSSGNDATWNIEDDSSTGEEDAADSSSTDNDTQALDTGDEGDISEPDTTQPDVGDTTDTTQPNPVECGAWAGDTCADDEYCQFPDGIMCDYADGSGFCKPRPTECTGDDFAQVCGCDGVTYRDSCAAHQAGTDVAYEGACGDPGDDATDPDAGDTSDTTDPAPVECGGWVGDTCADDEYCQFPEGTMCDYADGSGFCQPRPTQCTGDDFAQYCGCDGVTYRDSCAAHQAGTDVAHEGACSGGPGNDLCDPQDAQGEGMCDMVLGVTWNGSDCNYISGCSCEGTDCDKLYQNIEACTAAHTSCMDDCRTTGCPNPTDTCQICWTTYACVPAGAAC